MVADDNLGALQGRAREGRQQAKITRAQPDDDQRALGGIAMTDPSGCPQSDRRGARDRT